jgi:hypothetical protein
MILSLLKIVNFQHDYSIFLLECICLNELCELMAITIIWTYENSENEKLSSPYNFNFENVIIFFLTYVASLLEHPVRITNYRIGAIMSNKLFRLGNFGLTCSSKKIKHRRSPSSSHYLDFVFSQPNCRRTWICTCH